MTAPARSSVYETSARLLTLLHMQLTEEDVLEFSKLWEKEFHEQLSPDQARQHATLLLELYATIARTPPGAAVSQSGDNEKPHAS